jgi:hypothetical protein
LSSIDDPKKSNSSRVLSGLPPTGSDAFRPKRLCRTLKMVSPSLPY